MKDKSPVIMNISTMEDIKKLKNTPTIKYLNIDIKNPNLEVIYYLIENGQKYSYSELLDEMISIAIKEYKNKQKKIMSFDSNILDGFNGSKGCKGLKGLKN